MSNYKQDITLNEKDSLTDILMAEKELVKLYAGAMTEGSSKAFRQAIKSNLDTAVADQYTVFNTMSKQGLYEVKPADKSVMDQQKQTFTEQLNQMQ